MSFFRIIGAIILAGLPLIGAASQQPLSVVASIKPIALIAEQIAGSHAEVTTLVSENASPHHYALKVSEAKQLEQADLVIWVGAQMESFLAKRLHEGGSKVLTLAEIAGLDYPAHHDDVHNQVTHDDHGHHHGDDDLHIWLDPDNGALIARAIADRLIALNPAIKSDVDAHLKRFLVELAQATSAINAELTPVLDAGFIVYHDGYQHFVSHFGLNQLGFVTLTPERKPGAKHLYQLQKQFKGKVQCLFREPIYDARLTRNIVTALGVKEGLLDPLGTAKTSSYPQLLQHMSASFSACLHL